MPSRIMIYVAVATVALVFSIPGTAQTADFDILVDTDRNATTGCSVTPSGGASLTGFEHRLRASVNLATFQVDALDQSSCAGGSFDAPIAIPGFSVPYPLALNTGTGGADAVELAVARAALGATNLSQLRLTFVTDNGAGSDVLASADGAGGGPIVLGLPVQIPVLSIWGLGALVLVLLGLAWVAQRRMGRVGAVMAVMLVATAAWAMTFALDGDLSDWGGRAPNATDPGGDATDGSAAIDLVAGFVVLDGDYLFFRMDVSDTENQVPTADDDAFSTDEDTPFNVAAPGVLANDSDAELDPITAVLDAGPANAQAFTLNPDGSFDYTPNADFNGSDSFSYFANDGQANSAPATVTITVNPINDAPVAVDDVATTNEDTQVDIDVLANDSDIDGNLDPASVTVTTPPANGSTVVNPANGVITYTKSGDFNGADSFVYEVCDDGTPLPALCATASVSITVDPVNDAPTAAAGVATTDEDTPVVITLAGSDIDGDALTFAIDAGPANGTLGAVTPIDATSAQVTYTPAADFNGADSFTFTANDGTVDSAPATISLTINPVNDPPTADAGAAATDEDVPVMITLSGSDVDGDSLTFAIATGPANGTLGAVTPIDASSAQVTYTPAADFNGADGFTFTVNDGTVDSAAATVSLTVNAVNDPPLANDGVATTEEDIAVTITLNGSDVDGDPLTFAIAAGPGNGALGAITQLTPTTAEVTYTPTAAFSGADSFTFTANDGTVDSAAATISITVTPGNASPVANNAAPSTNEDTPVVVTLSGSDGDVDPLTFAIAGAPSNGALSAITPIDATSAQVTYTPNANFFGADSFTFTVNDGTETSPAATVSLTVNPVNDPPTVVNHELTTHSAIQITLGAGDSDLLKDGAADVDDAVADLTVSALPATSVSGAVLTLVDSNTGTYRYDPPGGFTGNDSFNYEVCDSATTALPVQCATGTVNVTVTGPALWVVDPAAAAGGDGSLNRPFQALSNLSGGRAGGARVFLASGTNAGGHTFVANEHLIGQGATGSSFDALLGVQVPINGALDTRPAMGGSRPVVQGQVVLAGGVTAQGFSISPPSGTQGLTGSGGLTGISTSQINVATTAAPAVNLNGVTGNFALDRVDANGGANGIVLVNTNSASGNFTVAGAGGLCTAATPTCTGGRIQATAGANGATAGNGVFLQNTGSVSLTRMRIGGHQNHAIFGTTVTGFNLIDSVIDGVNGNDAGADEGSVRFVNLLGAAAITRTDISGGLEDNLRLVNNTGTLDRLVITDTIFRNNSTALGNDGILIEAIGTATVNVTVDNSDFSAHRGDHFDAAASDSAALDLVFTNNNMSGGHPAPLGQSFIVSNAQSSDVTFDISGNTINSSVVTAYTFFQSASTTAASSIVGTFASNNIGTAGVAGSGSSQGSGVIFNAAGSGVMTVLANGNTIRQWSNPHGLEVRAGDGSPVVDVTVTGNLITEPNTASFPMNGLHLNAGTTAAGVVQLCLDVRSNDLRNSAGSAFDEDFRLRQRNNSAVRLPGYAGAATDTAAVIAFVQGNNTGTPSGSAVVSTGGFGGGAACATP